MGKRGHDRKIKIKKRISFLAHVRRIQRAIDANARQIERLQEYVANPPSWLNPQDFVNEQQHHERKISELMTELMELQVLGKKR